jgi:uncharacterized membrane protein
MRIVAIDQLKGVALILMIIYHIIVMIPQMNLGYINTNNIFIELIGKISHTIFILTSGINLYLSFKKNKEKFYNSQYTRLFKLLIGSLIMSYISYLAFGDTLYVKFGILHFLLISTLLSYPILESKKLSIMFLCINLIVILLISKKKEIFNSICKSNPLLCFNLGIYNQYNYNYQSLDHFPIFPKYSHFLIGVIMGQFIDTDILSPNELYLPKFVEILGKNTFEIYIVHWFVIYFIYYILGGRPIKSL